ncbi:M20/M25/M40 family metallo-hydrolase [Bacillus sp. B-jedd]|uniref:M20/M25/M40 family metallo-hydrolase n=1 Tax=Bacillus sp. B-jedd TaxID=1476857 RepID=UPI000515719A|nr:M20/M25/M40 family metallo-hydrolase [Bacillus sp. B-jedd]CEG25633.1 RocB protein [Bacillus sp. B-jedd]
MIWQSKQQLLDVLSRLVGIPSVSGTESETIFPDLLALELKNLPYFQDHPDHINVYHSPDGAYLRAFIEKQGTKKTIVMISHFDVVGVEDYGQLKEYAFNVEKLTEIYHEDPELLPETFREEFQSGDWVFGRGAMDMKAGIVAQMSLLERAAQGEIDGNLLFITVSDEEVSSKGMLKAIEEILHLKEEMGLEYVLCLNTEPSFKEHPHDTNKYMYTGTIGKMMPSFYFAGQETHVGEPFAGLNASLMAAALTMELELNSEFSETIGGEQTAALTNLMMRDLKEFYNVQTPTAAVSMYNLLFMEKSPGELAEGILAAARRAADKALEHYREKAELAGVKGLPFTIDVYTWEELYAEAVKSIGAEQAEELISTTLLAATEEDERGKSLKIVQQFASFIEKKPFIVFYFSPPFYPAVSSRNSELVQSLAAFVKSENSEIQERKFFQGLCDLSYATSATSEMDARLLAGNMPLYNNGYTIPFDLIKELDMPVFNLGPYGADPHQKTERLELEFSFGTLPDLLEKLVQHTFKIS